MARVGDFERTSGARVWRAIRGRVEMLMLDILKGDGDDVMGGWVVGGAAATCRQLLGMF